MASGLIEIMKMAAMEAQNASQPTDMRYGTVISVEPLEIELTNQLVLPESVLIVPLSLRRYNATCRCPDSGATEGIVIDNSLEVGDNVALLKQYGGQAYFVIDRV